MRCASCGADNREGRKGSVWLGTLPINKGKETVENPDSSFEVLAASAWGTFDRSLDYPKPSLVSSIAV
jgi:hypothetical protein